MARKMMWLTMIAVASTGLVACSSVPESDVSTAGGVRASSRPAGALAAQTAASAIPGYVHDLSRSRFRIGQGTQLELNAALLQRWRGTLGAFALDPSNGWTMALLDNTTPTGPYMLDDVAQGQAVKAYFVGAGVPADQVGAVLATYQAMGGGSMSAPATSAPVQLQSIDSILTRSVQGVRVVESYAWAKMTTSGDVDMESVFWPALDASVVNEAVALKSDMSQAALHSAYLSKLPGTVYRDDGVVIHHTDSSIHSTPVAYVSYDVTLDSAPSAAARHFDKNGVEFRLPQEQLPANSVSTKP